MSRRFLITGGAGFIGSNYVSRLLQRGEKVAVFDNLSRAGAEKNILWLQDTYGKGAFDLIRGDVRDSDAIRKAAAAAEVIVHLAAQVAVTTSVVNPREDFEINAAGTFNVMEAARQANSKPVVLYASTNKVYGGM
jgi:CDP-paratose 2-epimerase